MQRERVKGSAGKRRRVAKARKRGAGAAKGPPAPEPSLAQLLRAAYAAFNASNFEAVLGLMREDVDWEDTVRGGRHRGRDAVRRSWRRTFAVLRFELEPLVLREDRDQVSVEVRQRVSGAEGKALAVQLVRHVFRFKGGEISSLDAAEPL